jgi:hypothetical protein
MLSCELACVPHMQGEDEESRSPAPSPVRIQKRPRAVAGKACTVYCNAARSAVDEWLSSGNLT